MFCFLIFCRGSVPKAINLLWTDFGIPLGSQTLSIVTTEKSLMRFSKIQQKSKHAITYPWHCKIDRFNGTFSLNVNPYPFLGPIHYKEKLFDQFNKKADCSFSPLIFCRGSRNQIIFHYPTLGNHQVLSPFQFLQQKNRWFASPNCNKSQSCRHISMRGNIILAENGLQYFV